MKRILVTGSNGSLGVRVTQTLRNLYGRVHIVGLGSNINSTGVVDEYLQVDIAQLAQIERLKDIEPFDGVVHLAAAVHGGESDPKVIDRINHRATLQLAEVIASTAGEVLPFVFSSTVAVYGGRHPADSIDGEMISEMSLKNPETPYALSKLRAEKGLTDLSARGSIRLTILRLSTIIGRDDPGNLGKLISFARRFHALPAVRTKAIYKSFVDIDDAAFVIARSLEVQNMYNRVFNVATYPVTMAEVHKQINQLVCGLVSVPVPRPLLARVAPQLLQSVQIDAQASRSVLNFNYTSFKDSFKKEFYE